MVRCVFYIVINHNVIQLGIYIAVNKDMIYYRTALFRGFTKARTRTIVSYHNIGSILSINNTQCIHNSVVFFHSFLSVKIANHYNGQVCIFLQLSRSSCQHCLQVRSIICRAVRCGVGIGHHKLLTVSQPLKYSDRQYANLTCFLQINHVLVNQLNSIGIIEEGGHQAIYGLGSIASLQINLLSYQSILDIFMPACIGA